MSIGKKLFYEQAVSVYLCLLDFCLGLRYILVKRSYTGVYLCTLKVQKGEGPAIVVSCNGRFPINQSAEFFCPPKGVFI